MLAQEAEHPAHVISRLHCGEPSRHSEPHCSLRIEMGEENHTPKEQSTIAMQ